MQKRTQTKKAKLARQTQELAQAAPQVVAMRLGRMMTAGSVPSARDRREFHRMGAEKLAAFNESWQAMAVHSLAQQQQLMTWWAGAWWQWVAGGWMQPWTTLGQLSSGAGKQWEKAALETATRGLAPVHRRATANARRLKRGG